jgi:hypothetical protein
METTDLARAVTWSGHQGRQDARRHEDAGLAGGTAQRVGPEETLEGQGPVGVLLGRCWRTKQFPAASEVLAAPCREESVVPDADEARG